MAPTEIEEGVHFFLIISLSKALDNKKVIQGIYFLCIYMKVSIITYFIF